MKTDKIDKDIQKIRDKITDLQSQLKAKEQQKTEAENSEIVGMVRNLGVKPEDLAAFIKAYQSQQSQEVAAPVAEPAPAEPEQVELPAETVESTAADSGASDDSATTPYSSTYGSGYGYGGNAGGGYSFEDSED